MKRNSKSGFTLIESMVALVILSVVILAAWQLFAPLSQFFMHTQANQQMTNDSRIASDTIARVLRQGIANSASYCSCMAQASTCNSTLCTGGTMDSPIPNSHLDITLIGNATNYAIYWSSNTVQMDTWIYVNGSTQTYHQVLAHNVAQLNFSTPNSDDLAVVDFTLQMAVGQGGTWLATLNLPPQEVHMAATQ